MVGCTAQLYRFGQLRQQPLADGVRHVAHMAGQRAVGKADMAALRRLPQRYVRTHIACPRQTGSWNKGIIARIQGHSMEPRIPDGSLCVFRRNVVGSRNGRLVLVRNTELADDNQYTVKRYKSEKRGDADGFVQTRIRLESLNPAYPSWDLDEDADKYQVMAEFVRVLE